jgi:spore germination protein KB
MYIGARNLREAGDLLISASYDNTPLYVIHFAMISAVIYVLNKGVEVFFRLAEIYIIITIILGAIGSAAVVFSGIMDLTNLLPIQGEGWGEIFKAAYPHILLFPFGELVVFTTILPRLNNMRSARKTGIIAIMISGGLLSMTHALQVAVLGADIYGRAAFPLFTTISLVSIADFLQRLDAIVMLTLIIGVFFKMSVYCYGAMAIAADVFKVPDERKLAVPVGIVMLFGSMLSAWSYPEHAEEGVFTIWVHLNTFCAIVPVLLVIVHTIRKQLNLHR